MLWLVLCLAAAISTVSVVAINKKLLGTINEFKVASLYFIFTFLILTPFTLFFMDAKDYSILSLELTGLIALNGLLNVLAIYIYMKAIKGGDISVVVPIRNTTPLFVAFLAIILLSEIVTLNVFVASILIVLGTVALNYTKGAKPDFSNTKPSIYAFIVAIMAAMVFVIVKYSVSVINPLLFTYVSTLFSSIFVILTLIFNRKMRRFIGVMKNNIRWFFIVGMLTTIASLSVVYATSLEKASVVSAFLRVELLFSLFVGYLFFKEQITKSKILGALLIFIGLLLVIL